MQPQEIERIYEGTQAHIDEESQRMAYFVSWIIAPHLAKGKTVTAERIAKPLLKVNKKTPEQLLEEKQAFGQMFRKEN